MDKNFKFSFFLAVIALATSCSDKDEKISLPSPSGQPGELVVWCESGFWKSDAGDSLRKVLRAPVYGLPQSEPAFDLYHATDKNFGKVFKTFGNILILETDPDRFTEPKVEVKRNVWAERQAVIQITAKNRAELAEAFYKNAEDITALFNRAELNRLAKANADLGPEDVNKKLSEKLGINLYMMKGAYIAKTDSSTAWVRLERSKREGGFDHQISQGFVFVKQEYSEHFQLADYALLNLIDSVLKATVPGPVDNSYMHIDDLNLDPLIREVNYRDRYAKEMMGLWRVEGYMMGGPWYALHIVDEDKNEIISAFGYVYAPQFDKREYRREVEAVINSIYFENAENEKSRKSIDTAGISPE